MSSLHTSPLIEHWANFLMEMVTKKPDAYIQIRKFHNNVTWDIPWDVWNTDFDIEPEVCAYASWPTKYSQLNRNYFNAEEFDRVRQHFIDRLDKTQTCVTARFGNVEKKNGSMGFCMQTLSLNYVKKGPRHDKKFILEIYYRTTELGRKFTADIHYLHYKIIPYILQGIPIEPDLIRFRFCTAYYSSMFLPVIFNYRNPLSVVKAIKEGDFEWYDCTVSRSLTRWLEEENPYSWQTQAIQWNSFNERIKPKLTRPEFRALQRLGREER